MSDFVVETRGDDPGVLVVSGELDIATVDQLATEARTALEAYAAATADVPLRANLFEAQ